jgi:circadian clock protein KaiC
MTSATESADAPPRRIKTGITGLDQVLGGGLPRDRIYVVQGDPGSGKTTLALQFLLEGARAGERSMLVTLGETRAEVAATAGTHGWSLDGVRIFEMSALDQAETLEREATLLESSEFELQETTRRLLDEIGRAAPQRVVIDSVSELALLAQSPLRYRRQILALKQHFAGERCTALFLDDRSGERDDPQLMTLAHGVLKLEHIAPSYGEDRRRLRVIKMRGVGYSGGYHDFAIRRGGLRVFPRLQPAQHPRAFPGPPHSSGVNRLDELLGGGLDRGTATLLTGPAGAGKSIIATQFALAAAARGEASATFAFDEGAVTYFERARGLGFSLDEHVRSGTIELHPIDSAQMGPGEFASLTFGAVQRGVKLIVIDSLNGYLNAMADGSVLTAQLHHLFQAFAERGVSTLLVMSQYGLLGSMHSPVDVSYLSDTVLLLRYFEAAGRIRKAISVVKRRGGAHEDTIRELSIGKGGIRMGEPLTNFTGVLTGVPRFIGELDSLSGTS